MAAATALLLIDFQPRLAALAASALVIRGLTTPHCVATTFRMAANPGVAVTLAHDARAAVTANANPGRAPALPAPSSSEDIHIAAVSAPHGALVTARAADAITAGGA